MPSENAHGMNVYGLWGKGNEIISLFGLYLVSSLEKCCHPQTRLELKIYEYEFQTRNQTKYKIAEWYFLMALYILVRNRWNTS